jgi:hypothetical protein
MLEPYWNTNYAYHHSHRQQFDYLGFQKLASQLAFVNDSLLKPYQNQIETDAELILRCGKETGRLPVLTLDSNPYDVDSYVQKLNQYLDNKKYFVFHSDIRQSQSWYNNVAPWPSWLMYQHFLPDSQANIPKSKRLSFLSGIPRAHRMYLFEQIKPLVTDQDVVVINSFQKQHMNLSPDISNSIPWSNRPEYFDSDQNQGAATDMAHISHPAYQACVNITGETLGTGDQVLPSEKTWKAYKSSCLVINYGVEQMPIWLASVGIEIWKPFDLPQDFQIKTKQIKELFASNNIFDMYNDNLAMIEHNKNLVMSKSFCHLLAEPAIKKIESLL